jgi:ABC-type branched-subunit amino acid transport system substrate-binding protein
MTESPRPSTMRIALLILVAVVASAGCGARVTDEQRLAAGGAGGGTTQTYAANASRTALDVNAGLVESGSTGASGSADEGADNGQAATPTPQPGTLTESDVGVSSTEVKLGNVSTLSGPVPGIFEGAVIGSQAIVAYQNSLGGVNGRRLRLDIRDDQFDSGQNRAQTIDLLPKVFAFLGSFSLYDDAAANEIGRSGIPDLTYSLSGARRRLANNLSVQPAYEDGWQLGYFNWYKQQYPDAVHNVGAIYGDVPAAKATYLAARSAATSLGYRFVYERGIQPTETDFTADVVRMRQAGVQMVYIALDGKGSARIAKAMQQQQFEPEVTVSLTAYDRAFLPLAGDAAEGMTVPQLFSMFQGEDDLGEIQLMNQWLRKIKPGYVPDLYAVYAWAQGRLLFEAMQRTGPNLTRSGLIRVVRDIGTFDANGLIGPANPARKVPPTCFIVMKVQGGTFRRLEPARGFRCDLGGYHRASGEPASS